jgi:cobalt-zinc-cadmium efflux system membrane fusion protein
MTNGEMESSPDVAAARFPKQWVKTAAAVLVLAAAGSGVWAASRRPHPVAPLPTPPFSVTDDRIDIRADAATWRYVELAEARVGEPIAPAPVPARVAFDEARSQPIIAPLPGRVEVVAARLGQRVEVNERLVAVRSTALVDLSREIEQLRADEAARAKTVERLRALVDLKAVPEKDLVAAQQELRSAQLARDAADLKRKSLPGEVTGDGMYWLTARRAGVVVERSVLTGQEVGPERAEPLLVVAELDEVIVAADVPETDVGGIEVGQSASVLSPALPDHALTGRVEYVGEVVDPLRRMVNVRIRVSNAGRALRPNAFVQVGFAAEGPGRVLLPAEAVVTNDQRSFVFVRPPDHPQRLERRAVTPGRRSNGHVEIMTGLAPGETYVTKGAILLLNAVDLAES